MNLNTALLKVQLRAERGEPSVLVKTFVDVGHLFALLSTGDHQVLYGRRGTGKTHALKFLAERVRVRGQIAVYVDMRTIGSSGGLYGDTATPLAERATRLLMDTFGAIHDALVDIALSDSVYTDLLPRLDALADVATDVRVTGGSVERELAESATLSEKAATSMSLGYPVAFKGEDTAATEETRKREVRRVEKGQETHRVHFGAASKQLASLVAALPAGRLWLILDEWSVVPLDLQPFLADFLKRCVLPVSGATLKIGAIEHRSRFRAPSAVPGDYIGLELGADTSANLDLDDFMVANSDPDRAKAFFRDLLFRHVEAVFAAEGETHPALFNAETLVAAAFTQHNAFDDWVRAAEGVPRDAVNILSQAAQKAAAEERLSVQHIRHAALQWYQRDKFPAATANTEAAELLNWIVDQVIGGRRARAFLLKQGESHPLIDILYDSRVLHVVRRGVSGGDVAGVRFNVYALDFGCYVHLFNTKKAPSGLFATEDEAGKEVYAEVPQDDYRSIRRAILDLSRFERHLQTRGA
ncbi:MULTISPECIES: hypothetical protein [unclassified Anaeromyxobacter]|uniref:ORC-CDC6 family AAA ATPase n=1 Tax=unclassified Anaeromyxobacter TaxID=2620896 RepID=UPI001F5A483A|nr:MULTISPECIES: hypothetical protein [unclassified Anaeromyxobacter]